MIKTPKKEPGDAQMCSALALLSRPRGGTVTQSASSPGALDKQVARLDLKATTDRGTPRRSSEHPAAARSAVSVSALPVRLVRTCRQKRSLPSFIALALMALLGMAACTGSPATLALQPDFVMTTPMGPASVSIREVVPGFTDSEFERLVRAGMKRAAPDAVLSGPVQPPFPEVRIVWHVNSDGHDGVSSLVVNIFKGSEPFAYERAVIENGAPRAMIVGAVESMTKRLIANDLCVHEAAPGWTHNGARADRAVRWSQPSGRGIA